VMDFSDLAILVFSPAVAILNCFKELWLHLDMRFKLSVHWLVFQWDFYWTWHDFLYDLQHEESA